MINEYVILVLELGKSFMIMALKARSIICYGIETLVLR